MAAQGTEAAAGCGTPLEADGRNHPGFFQRIFVVSYRSLPLLKTRSRSSASAKYWSRALDNLWHHPVSES